MSEFLPFPRPVLGEADLAAVGEVLQSGWITARPKCAELEQAFCN
ncbi:MAG: UDP-4-amino-4-deoxy-L-arabinose--oxoglutarate aminotransferase [Sodalis sp.]|nr:MAG: UDP-4-amino-4-deoxy-L-arabinose--oxoglutarate aminotransferase [Sodalis sp.]